MATTRLGSSRAVRLLLRFLRRSWQWLVVGVLALALGAVAFASPGLERADVHLDEGTVYATNRSLGLVGTVNTQIKEVAAATGVGDTNSSVMQYQDTVLVRGEESNTLSRYDPGRNRMESPKQLPVGAQVQMVGPMLLIASPENGRVWYGRTDDVLAMDFAKDKAQFEVGVAGLATLTTSGDVIGLDVEKSTLVRKAGEQRQTQKLPFTVDVDRAASLELSAVGEKAVVLDRSTGRIWVEGMTDVFDVSGATGARLLPPADRILGGGEDVRAVYATEAGLIGVTTDGPRSLSGQMGAETIPPVQLGDCLYGLFGDKVVRRCPDKEPQIQQVPGLGGGDHALSFLVNRRVVALGEANRGVVWLVDDAMARIDQWDQFVREDTKQPPPPDAPLTNERSERSEDNHPPVAQDDDLIARSGRATILDVLDNDSDPDGDVLKIDAPAELDGASLQPVRDGTGLQITIPAETTKRTLTFSYTISDGELSASAEVTVTVADADPARQNKPPYPFELATPVSVQKGKAFTKRLLLDWRDPEGDPLILEDAFLPPGSEDLITFNPDGTINYQDIGKTSGVKKIGVKVSDGTDTADGELLVNVVDEPVKPVAHADYATVQVGESVTIKPLENDFGEHLTLQEVTAEDCSDCKVTPDYTEDRFSFAANKAGTYYLTYNVSAGLIDTGVVRVDVVEPSRDNPPVAALDVALLPPEGSVFIDPLLNDTDPDGDVLVIQSVTADPSLEVKLERRHLMTIRARTTPKAPVTVEYVVSDGRHIARGTVVVIPTTATGSVVPKAEDDNLNVRAGTIATATVLSNDVSPIGLELRLNRILESPFGDDVWIDGNAIRVRAPAGAQRPQTAIPYEVIDEEGNTATATLTVTTISEDAPNVAPAPKEVVDRVLAGSTTRIPIDIDGIDPNGDAVRLVGLGAGPKLGRIVEVGEEFLTYEAFPTSQGTDTFQYRVQDALGEEAQGQIRIGIAKPGKTNLAPVAVHDQISVRPGRPIQIAALANDYDFEGDQFGFAKQDAVTIDDPTAKVSIENEREIVISPITEPGRVTGTYRIVDSRGQEGIGSFTVDVGESAPLLPPTTRDDTLAVSDVLDKQFVEVDVLANDFDRDGPHEELQLSLPGVKADDPKEPRVVDGKLSVPVRATMQQVRYKASDADGKSAFGLATVPGTNDVVPMVRDASRVVVATAGQPVQISFEDLLVGTAGRAVKLTSTDTIVPTNGTAVPSADGIQYTPAEDYQGPAAVAFEVVDVVPEGDNSAKRAFVTIKLDVKPAPHQRSGSDGLDTTQLPPEQLTTAVLQVGPAEGKSRLSLMPLFRDPQGLDFNFHSWEKVSGDAPISWSTESGQSVIVAEAPIDAKRGTRIVLKGKVENAQSAWAPVEVVLEMVGSKQPTTTAAADVVDKVPAGQPIPVPVLANDVSHVADPKLTVVGARIISGKGKIEHAPDKVTITPEEGFVGTLTASYSVQDATGDPARVVDGTIRMTVVSKPDRPSAPFNGVVGDGQIRFEYRSGSSNGYPIDKREVVATAPGQGAVTQECAGNTCTITGLRNNVPWTLQVVEYNKLGPSEPSPASAAYTPDVKPLPPGAPVVERGDRQLTIQWQEAPFANPENKGSPIEKYTLTMYDASGKQLGVQELAGDRREHVWTGLTNGTNYTFTVTAANRAGASGPSEKSTPIQPVGPPLGNASLVVNPMSDGDGGAFSVAVAPGNLQANGDPAMKLQLMPIVDSREDPGLAQEVPFPPDASRSITMSGFGTAGLRFRVYAQNLHSRRVVAETAQAIVAWPKPRLDSLSISATPDMPGRIRVTFATGIHGDDAVRAGQIPEYRVNGGPWHRLQWNGEHNAWYTKEYPHGVQVQAQVRLVLSKSKDKLSTESQPETVTPLAPWPKALAPGRIYAHRPDEVRVAYESAPTSEESGGWTQGSYFFEPDDGRADGSNVYLPDGTHKVGQRWKGTRPGTGGAYTSSTIKTDTYQVGDISNFAIDGNGVVTISVNHAWEGSKCDVLVGEGNKRQTAKTVNSDANGRISLKQAFPKDPLQEPGENWKRVHVSCQINGQTAEWTRDLK